MEHSPVVAAEEARTAAVGVGHRTVAEGSGPRERRGHHTSAAIEDQNMIVGMEVVLMRPAVCMSKDAAEPVGDDLPCHFVLEQAVPELALVLHLPE